MAIISSHCFLLLHLWGGGGIRVNGLQSASALLLAYMEKDIAAAHCSKRACVPFFLLDFPPSLSPLWAPHCNCTYLRDGKRQRTDIPVAVQALPFFSPSDFKACVAVRDCFIRGIFMGGECRLSY